MSFLKGFGVAFAAVVAVGIIACGGGDSSGGASGDDKACEDGDKKACEKVLSTLKAECDKSNASSCARLGFEYALGARQIEEVEGYFRSKSFDEDLFLASVFFLDEKAAPKGIVERDDIQAQVSIIRACDLNHGMACLLSPLFYQEENSQKARDLYAKGVNALEKECDSGNLTYCAVAGLAYMMQPEGERDFFKAKVPLQKYCDKVEKTDKMIESGACLTLGNMYMRGEGVTQDIEKAKVYFKKVCEGGDQSGCDRFKNANERTMK